MLGALFGLWVVQKGGGVYLEAGYPLHRENRENDKKKIRENTGNLEILPKHRDLGLLKLPNKFTIFIWKLDKFAKSVLCICNSHKSCKLAQGKFAVGQGYMGNLKMQFGFGTPVQVDLVDH